MFNLSNLIGEFDPATGIVHLTARHPVHATTLEQGRALALAIRDILGQYLADRRGYMISDFTKIILEPEHISVYAEEVQKIIDTYLHPGGIARYGMQISRITASLGHRNHLGGNPNLFETKEEAHAFIHGLIAQGAATPAKT